VNHNLPARVVAGGEIEMSRDTDSRTDIVVDGQPPRRRRLLVFVLAGLAVVVFGSGATLSYYVDALWFESLGYTPVFWTRLDLEAATFGAFALITFLALYRVFLALKPAQLDELIGGTIFINRQWVKLPIEAVLSLIALGLALAISAAIGASMMARWTTLALYWYAPRGATTLDPVFGRPLSFYLFTLPALQLIAGWLLTLAVIALAIAALFVAVTGSARALTRRRSVAVETRPWHGLSIGFAAVLLTLAARVYLGRFERLFQDGTIFAGVTYTDAHVTLTGMLVVCVALIVGAAMAGVCAISPLHRRWLVASVVPAIVCYVIVAVAAWYVSSFIVKPNQLVRERPFIAHNIEMTRRAYALDRIEPHPFPADSGIEALDYVSKLLSLAYLAPDLTEAILDGRQPPRLMVKHIRALDVPLEWNAQRRLFARFNE
jgi:hypothetical protein